MLIRLVEFFSTPLGTNYHSFAIQLTLTITLLSYLYISIKSRSIPSIMVLLAMGFITIFQFFLGGIDQINLGIPFYGPSLDRALILLQILWVFPALNPSKKPLRQGLVFVLGSILLAGFSIWLTAVPQPVWEKGNFNFSDQAFYWSCSILAVSTILALVPRQGSGPITHMSRIFYLFMVIGAGLDMLFVPFVGDYAGFVRLGLLFAMPLLMALPTLSVQPANGIDKAILRAFIKRIEQTTDEFFVMDSQGSFKEPMPPPQSISAQEPVEETRIPEWTGEHTQLLNEVKQPLFSIIGYADLLSRETHGTLGEVQKKYIDRIRSAASSIEYKVEEIQRLREVEQGNVRYIPELIDLFRLVHTSLENFSFLIKEKELQIKVDAGTINPKLVTDRSSLLSVLNLATENAVIASRVGSSVTVSLAEAQQPGYLRCIVADSGQGVEESELPLVFEKRVALSDPLLKGLGDKGVGLSVLRSLVDGLHGQVSVESTPEVGTRIIIDLPRNLAGSFQPIPQDEA